VWTSLELEPEQASAPPWHGDPGDAGLAQHRRVGATLQANDDRVSPVEDDPTGLQEAALDRVGRRMVVAGQPPTKRGACRPGKDRQHDVQVNIERDGRAEGAF